MKNDFQEGIRRYIKLAEYNCNRHIHIRTDASYWLYDHVKDSSMENRDVDFDIDEMGFISTPPQTEDAELKIAFLGDSVVESAIVSQEKRFPYQTGMLLAKLTGKSVKTFNAGYSGVDITRINTLFLTKIVPMGVNFAVCCSCIHDVIKAIEIEDYHKYYIERSYEYEYLPTTYLSRVKLSARDLFPKIYRLLYIKKHKKEKETFIKSEVVSIKQMNWVKKRIESVVRKNLILFIQIARANDITPVLSTEANTLKLSSERYINIFEHEIGYDRTQFSELMELTNNQIRDVCKEMNVLCVDLDKEISNHSAYIYDVVHLTDEGSLKAAEIISNLLQNAQ